MSAAKYTATFTDKPGAKARYRQALKLMGAEGLSIAEAEVEATEPKPKKDNTPTKPVPLAIAALFNRSPETEWTDAEMTAFGNAHRTKTLTLENMKLVAEHYERERRKPENFCRTNLLRFLRYWTSELDKARAAKPKASRALEWPDSNKVVPMPTDPAEAARIAEQARVAAAEFRRTHSA